MSPEVTYGVGGGELTEEPPILFRNIRGYVGDDRYHYVMRELRSMIHAGTLSVTDCLRQPSFVRDAVGLTLHGKVVDPATNTHRAAESWEDFSDVHGHRVAVRPIDGRANNVKFKRGVVQNPVPRRLPGSRGQAVGGDPDNMRTAVRDLVDETVTYNENPAMLPLREAWVCLSKHGKHCVTANSKRLQERYWIYEEVRPEPPKTRPVGRPRKADG